MTHKLIDILIITTCAVISEAEGYAEREMFGQEKEKCLRQYFELPSRIPSQDCFRYLFIKLDVKAFEKSFQQWMKSYSVRAKEKGNRG